MSPYRGAQLDRLCLEIRLSHRIAEYTDLEGP